MKNKLRVEVIKRLLLFIEKFTFELSIKKYYRKIFRGNLNVVLDIGTNDGQSIDIFRSINTHCIIYGFEPNAKLFPILEKKYKNVKNVKLFNKGVSSKTGKKKFYSNVLDLTSSFEKPELDSDYIRLKAKILGLNNPEMLIDSEYEVEIVTLNDFILSYNIKQIDVIKIDVEGHELDCLQGLFGSFDQLQCQIKYIQIEEHQDDMYRKNSTEIIDLLNENNFYECKRIKHYVGEFEEVIFKNNSTE